MSSDTVSTCGSVAYTSATSSTGKDARSTPPGSPRLSFQHQTPSVGFSLEDLNNDNQVDPMANTAAWVTELEEVHVDALPIPQWYINQSLAIPPVVEDLSIWLAREFPDEKTSGVGSPHHDQNLPTETLKSGDDDQESDDVEIVYEEVELEEEPDTLAELAQLLGI
ncbi:hypothetical protein INS49_011986 [Diaporthe citri]|uniref:uncharacterized protein n=1 Tax=Diaporthe citri TaxID=83186 RepID=UPI001C80B7C5|nr:uncharacterized protein INS49_011986 [Diaporthe citri]KAG6360918.1 hypothetical protein INS49_011986 [Diaporthe citri]